MDSNNSRINDNNYYVINGWMINRLRLKGVSLSAYAIIYGFSQDGDNEFTGSLQYLCDFCGGVSKPTIIKALKELTEKKYIIRREEYINNIMFTRYRANHEILHSILSGGKNSLPVVKNLSEGSKETLPEGSKNSLMGSKETLPNKESNNKGFNKEKEKEILFDSQRRLQIVEIVEHLNNKAGTAFRATSKATKEHINARLEEGFTIDDFKTVIDKKCDEWIGTDFAQYLRPATLFGTKFEGYLNAPAKARKTYGQSGIEIAQTEKEDDLAGIL